jgi:hypothetical protein
MQNAHFRNFHFLQSQVSGLNGALSMISNRSVLQVDFDSDAIISHRGSLHTGIMNNVFFCSVQTCHESLKIWGRCWSCFSRKLILVTPMHQAMPLSKRVVSCIDSSQLSSQHPQLLHLHLLETLFFFSQRPSTWCKLHSVAFQPQS